MNVSPPKTEGRPLVVGANHRSSSMLLRDRLFVEEHAMSGVLEALAGVGAGDALLLSTCDRVEVQAIIGNDVDEATIVEGILGVLAGHGETPVKELDGQTYAYWDSDAVRQVFAVSASLDSLVIGEPQVLGQVKANLLRLFTYPQRNDGICNHVEYVGSTEREYENNDQS